MFISAIYLSAPVYVFMEIQHVGFASAQQYLLCFHCMLVHSVLQLVLKNSILFRLCLMVMREDKK